MGKRTAISERELDYATKFIVRAIDEHFEGNQSLAARAFGCNPSSLNRIRNGSRKPVTIVSGVATALGVSVDTVLGRTRSEEETRVVVPFHRYPSREEAIRKIAEDPQWKRLGKTEIARAADAFGLALDSDSDPGFGYWYDGIRDQLKLWRKGQERLGVRELDDDE